MRHNLAERKLTSPQWILFLQQARGQIVTNLLANESNSLSSDDLREVAHLTEGYSGSDMHSLCSDAAMGPVRAIPPSQIVSIDSAKVRGGSVSGV